MLEIKLTLRDYGPTSSYHRWIDNEKTRMYVRKRILPDTIPGHITILITDNREKTVGWDVRADVIREKVFDDTVRYEPTGISINKIGMPDISKNLLKQPYPKELYIGIRWKLVK